jgi:hypothetical protein
MLSGTFALMKETANPHKQDRQPISQSSQTLSLQTYEGQDLVRQTQTANQKIIIYRTLKHAHHEKTMLN